MAFTINVNGKTHTVDVPGDMPLLWVLRDKIDLKGTKFGCGVASCGACTVHIDGKVARSCVTPISSVGGGQVVTIEGIGTTPIGQAVQKAWLDVDVLQCGYCQAGQIMAASALIASAPKPTDQQIDEAMSGNACRCATYVRIREAIKTAAGVAVAASAVPSAAPPDAASLEASLLAVVEAARRFSGACSNEGTATRTEAAIDALMPHLPSPLQPASGAECSVCLQPLVSTDTHAGGLALVVLPCQHIFHRSCIRTWWVQSAPSPQCALCKQEVSRTALEKEWRAWITT